MALTLDPLLTLKTDFVFFKDVSKNIDDERFNQAIRMAQMQEIRAFLGDALYLALILDYTPGVPPAEGTFSESRFTDLWFGAEYTRGNFPVKFNGLKTCHIFYSYERLLYWQRLNVTRYGSRVLQDNEFSDNMDSTKKYEVSADSEGLVYQEDARKFMAQNSSTYPEWDKPERKQPKTTGFKFEKVGKTIGR